MTLFWSYSCSNTLSHVTLQLAAGILKQPPPTSPSHCTEYLQILGLLPTPPHHPLHTYILKISGSHVEEGEQGTHHWTTWLPLKSNHHFQHTHNSLWLHWNGGHFRKTTTWPKDKFCFFDMVCMVLRKALVELQRSSKECRGGSGPTGREIPAGIWCVGKAVERGDPKRKWIIGQGLPVTGNTALY